MPEPNSSEKTLVVGLGNPLSGDDAFGAQVLEKIGQDVLELAPSISRVYAHTDLLSQIESFPEYDRVLIIDAILDPDGKMGRPGQIVALNEEAFLSSPETSPSVHQTSPLLAIRLFRRLYPASQTRITLVGLVVDQIRQDPCHLTDESIMEGAEAVRALIRG